MITMYETVTKKPSICMLDTILILKMPGDANTKTQTYPQKIHSEIKITLSMGDCIFFTSLKCITKLRWKSVRFEHFLYANSCFTVSQKLPYM